MHVIGLDIGGTSIKGMVIDPLGHILAEASMPTEAVRGKAYILSNVKDVISQLVGRYPDVSGIGIGTAGRVNVHSGEIVYATGNLPGWGGCKLKEEVQIAFRLPVWVDNDANVALLGESWLGAGQGYAHVTMLTLGTGVGGANLIQGQLIQGASWNGGEWGHVILVPHGRPCNCGQFGCIEQYISGTAFVEEARQETAIPFATGIDVLKAYRNGHAGVVGVVERFIDYLTIVIYNIHLGINPDTVIIGGGLVDSHVYWWHALEQHIASFGLGISVSPAKLGNKAGAIGAAKMAISRQ